jgi:hypothetical protein
LNTIEQQFKNDTDNFTNEVVNAIRNTTQSDVTAILERNFNAITFPTMPINFTLGLNSIPQSQLQIEFNDLEIYVELETILLGPTFTINLFTSDTPLGLGYANTQLGVTFTIDLIVNASTEIDIFNGFHLKLEDNLSIQIDMFGKNASNIEL